MGVIRNEELNKSIAPARQNTQVVYSDKDREVLAFSKGGKEVVENHPDVYCKAVKAGDKTWYYALRGPTNRLFNPNDLNYDDAHRIRNSKSERTKYSLKECSPKVFKLYLTFLETNNKSFLNNAERES